MDAPYHFSLPGYRRCFINIYLQLGFQTIKTDD